MPTVRTYGARQVLPTAVPGVRKVAAETDISTGAGLARAQAESGRALAGLGAQLTQAATTVIREEREKADRTMILELENETARWKHKRLYDPESGALMVQGKDAMPLPEEVNAEFEEFMSTLGKRAVTDRQRELFAKLKNNTGLELDLTLRRHVAGEMQQYAAGELKANVENHVNDAIANANDPEKIGEKLTAATSAIQAGAKAAGMGPEQIEEAQAAARTEVHSGVVKRLLAQGKDRAAKAYFEESKDQISGDKLPELERALEAGTTLGEAQRAADQIIKEGGSFAQQREKAKAIDDPDVRKETLALIEHEEVVQDKINRDREEATLISAYNVVDKTKSVSSINPVVWASLDGAQRSALHHYAKMLASGTGIKTDIDTYQALLDQAANDPATFNKQNLLNYRGKLDDPEYKQIAQLQLSLRQGDRKAADEALAGYRTEAQIINNSLESAGIDPNDKDKRGPIGFLRQQVGEMATQYASVTGKKAGPAEIQAFVDDVLQRPVNTPGSWWNIFGGDQQKSVIDVTVDDVPKADRLQIEAALKARGWIVNDANVLDLYLRKQRRTGR